MPWFVYSMVSSLGFVGMILCVRKLTNEGFVAKQILMFLAGFGFFALVIWNLFTPGELWQSDQLIPFLVLTVITGCVHVAGNWADFTSIGQAPNPGYAVTIRNATILPVTFLAPFLFGSPGAGAFQWLASFLILAGMALTVYERKNTAASHLGKFPSWHVLAFGALFCFTLGTLLIKQTTTLSLVSPAQIMLMLFGIHFAAFTAFTARDAQNFLWRISGRGTLLTYTALAAAFALVANWAGIIGLALSPNPGYNSALQNTNAALVSLVAIPLFGSEWNARKMAGVALVSVGTIMLTLFA